MVTSTSLLQCIASILYGPKKTKLKYGLKIFFVPHSVLPNQQNQIDCVFASEISLAQQDKVNLVQIKNQKSKCSVSCVACSDGDELKKSLSELADTKNDNAQTKSISRISSGSNPFLDIAHDPNAAVYKTGFLARKIHADMDGKKSKTNK